MGIQVSLKEFKEHLSSALSEREKEWLTTIEEEKRKLEAERAKEREELDKLKAVLQSKSEALDKQHTDFMAKIGSTAAAPRETTPTERIASFVRAVYHGRGDQQRAIDWASKQGHDWLGKALGADDFTAGGAFVPEVLANEIIEFLRPRSVIRSLQPMMIPMPNGSVSIPKLTGGATATWVGESVAPNATQATTGQLRLDWKSLVAQEPMTRQWLQYSNPGSDAAIRDDLVNAFAQAEDLAFIRGTGTAFSPKGLRYWAVAGNIGASHGTDDGTVPELSEVEQDLRELIQALEGSDVRMIRPVWIMSPRSKNFLTTLRDASDLLLAFPETRTRPATLWGFPLGVTNNVPSDLAGNGTETVSELYLVDMADAVVGDSTNMEIRILDQASYLDQTGTLVSAPARNEVVLVGIENVDFGMRHDESVAIKTSVVYGAK
jgi:HK97 family phage major capsid protein